MFLKFRYLLIIGILIFIFSCRETTKKPEVKYQFKEYYYPIDELRTGKAYVYTPVNNDSLESFIWFFTNNGGYLVKTEYNSTFQTTQIITEDIVRNGTLLHRHRLCQYFPEEPDICQPIDVKVESPAVFPFQMIDSSSVFLYEISWKELTDTMIENRIIRNRHFMGYETKEWQGKTYDCVKFGIREEISVGSESDGYQTFRAFTEEYYAKGIGLIHMKKKIQDVMELEYELADTTNMYVLEQMFSAQNN
jgi:hypothetical protein